MEERPMLANPTDAFELSFALEMISGIESCTAYGETTYEFSLLEDGTVELSASEFAEAVECFLSKEFSEVIETRNKHEIAYEDYINISDEYLRFVDSVIAEDSAKARALMRYKLHDLFTSVKFEYSHESMFLRKHESARKDCEDTHGWTAYINACRLYEYVYKVPREWI